MKSLAVLLVFTLIACVPAAAEISRNDAATAAQRTTGGRVLSIERTSKDGHDVWRVKVVTPKGEVQVLHYDVESGRVV